MKRMLVLGATPYAEVFADSFTDPARVTFAGFVENLNRERCGALLSGLPILWFEDLEEWRETYTLACALGTTLRKPYIEDMEARRFRFDTLVHGWTQVSRRTALGHGVSVDAGSVIAGFSTIRQHVRIGRRVSIGHHSDIGAYSTIHPAAVISGNCRLGSQVTVGTGAVLIDGIEIGDGAVVAAGAVVTTDVPARAAVRGNPARISAEAYGPR